MYLSYIWTCIWEYVSASTFIPRDSNYYWNCAKSDSEIRALLICFVFGTYVAHFWNRVFSSSRDDVSVISKDAPMTFRRLTADAVGLSTSARVMDTVSWVTFLWVMDTVWLNLRALRKHQIYGGSGLRELCVGTSAIVSNLYRKTSLTIWGLGFDA